MSRMVSAQLSPLDYAKLTNDQLRTELAEQVSLTAESLLRASLIWTELQRRGVDLSAFRSGLAKYLPRIARRELAAEAVVTFAGQRTLLQHFAGMPLEDQRRYSAGQAIKIAERNESGQVVSVERRLTELTGREVVLALQYGRVRSFDEQRSSLDQQMAQPTRIRRSSGGIARIRAQSGLLQVGRMRIHPLDLVPALKILGFDLKLRNLSVDENAPE